MSVNMVGYERHDVLTSNEKLIAGCLSGVTTRFVTQPLDIIKLRTQLQKKKTQIRTFWIVSRMLKEEGIRSFWHGHMVGQIHSILSVSSQFYMFELTTKHSTNVISNKKTRSFVCGLFAGCTSAAIVIPLEVVRVRQMIVKDQYGGLIKGAKQVYKSGGVLAFYEGLSASLLQMGPAAGISFAVFSNLQPFLINYISERDCKADCKNTNEKVSPKPEHVIISSTIAGSAAGFLSKTITYPFDLAKRRLQIASHRPDGMVSMPSSARNLISCNNLVECLINSFKHGGIRGLFQGWKVTTYKAQITSVVAFTTYETICYFIREVIK